jgi:hypothetical protein
VDDSGELIVHDRLGQQLLVLNQVGAAIFELLDGELDVGQIAGVLVDTLGIAHEQATVDVERFIGDLVAREIVVLQTRE